MLQKIIIHFSLILLFALTQMGVATHEISHLTNGKQHTQPIEKYNKNNKITEQCSQCISYAKIASGVLSLTTTILINQPGLITTTSAEISAQYQTSHPYFARAPPQIASI